MAKVDTKLNTQRDKDQIKDKVTNKQIGRKLLTSRANAVGTMSAETSELLFGKSVEDDDIVD